MTPEEIKTTIEFILNQQAQFTVDIQLLKESQKKFTENQTQMSLDIENLRISVTGLLELSRQSMETADSDRRIMREMVQDLKEAVYRSESKSDAALGMVRELAKNIPDPEKLL